MKDDNVIDVLRESFENNVDSTYLPVHTGELYRPKWPLAAALGSIAATDVVVDEVDFVTLGYSFKVLACKCVILLISQNGLSDIVVSSSGFI